MLISEDVLEKQIFSIDITIYRLLVSIRSPILNSFFMNITYLGSSIALISVSVLWIIFAKNKSDRLLIFINIITSSISNVLLKYQFARPRPIESRLMAETGYSFPSGHAMISTAVYGLLIYLIYKRFKNHRLRNIVIGLLIALIILIDVSRVYVGVHYTSDVVAGTCISIAYLILILSCRRIFHLKKFLYKKGNEK
jgi:undecaprenyl-diphosphatase